MDQYGNIDGNDLFNMGRMMALMVDTHRADKEYARQNEERAQLNTATGAIRTQSEGGVETGKWQKPDDVQETVWQKAMANQFDLNRMSEAERSAVYQRKIQEKAALKQEAQELASEIRLMYQQQQPASMIQEKTKEYYEKYFNDGNKIIGSTVRDGKNFAILRDATTGGTSEFQEPSIDQQVQIVVNHAFSDQFMASALASDLAIGKRNREVALNPIIVSNGTDTKKVYEWSDKQTSEPHYFVYNPKDPNKPTEVSLSQMQSQGYQIVDMGAAAVKSRQDTQFAQRDQMMQEMGQIEKMLLGSQKTGGDPLNSQAAVGKIPYNEILQIAQNGEPQQKRLAQKWLAIANKLWPGGEAGGAPVATDDTISPVDLAKVGMGGGGGGRTAKPKAAGRINLPMERPPADGFPVQEKAVKPAQQPKGELSPADMDAVNYGGSGITQGALRQPKVENSNLPAASSVMAGEAMGGPTLGSALRREDVADVKNRMSQAFESALQERLKYRQPMAMGY